MTSNIETRIIMKIESHYLTNLSDFVLALSLYAIKSNEVNNNEFSIENINPFYSWK